MFTNTSNQSKPSLATILKRLNVKPASKPIVKSDKLQKLLDILDQKKKNEQKKVPILPVVTTKKIETSD